MITELLIQQITGSLDSDHNQVMIAIELCRTKGILTKQEIMQLDNQGLPISRIIRTIFHMKQEHPIEIILDRYPVTYNDLMCMIGIIAQDVMLKQKNRITLR